MVLLFHRPNVQIEGCCPWKVDRFETKYRPDRWPFDITNEHSYMLSRQPKLPPRGAPRRWVLRICSFSWGTAQLRSGKTWILWWWNFNKMISHLLQVQRLVKYLTAHEVSTMSRFCNISWILKFHPIEWNMMKCFIILDVTLTRKEADGDPADPTIGRHSKRCKDFFQVVKNLILGATFLFVLFSYTSPHRWCIWRQSFAQCGQLTTIQNHKL